MERILQFFSHEHLPERLAEISRPFSDLANEIVRMLPPNDECREALRKLLEAKDCAVRARLSKVVEHRLDCAVNMLNPGPCNCGTKGQNYKDSG